MKNIRETKVHSYVMVHLSNNELKMIGHFKRLGSAIPIKN